MAVQELKGACSLLGEQLWEAGRASMGVVSPGPSASSSESDSCLGTQTHSSPRYKYSLFHSDGLLIATDCL